MAEKDVERLIGKAVLDPEFRAKLFADPKAAIDEAGLELTDQEMAAVEAVDAEKAERAIQELTAASEQPWA